MQPQQPGYNSSRVYLELLADLPWEKASEELELDLKAVKERLDNDHYGLTKVKQQTCYTQEEKLKIAMRHLISRVLEQHGLSSEFLKIPEVYTYFEKFDVLPIMITVKTFRGTQGKPVFVV